MFRVDVCNFKEAQARKSETFDHCLLKKCKPSSIYSKGLELRMGVRFHPIGTRRVGNACILRIKNKKLW